MWDTSSRGVVNSILAYSSMTDIEGLISAPQAAVVLGVARKTLYRYSYVYDDFPQPVKIGRTVLYDPDALRAWREQHPVVGKHRA